MNPTVLLLLLALFAAASLPAQEPPRTGANPPPTLANVRYGLFGVRLKEKMDALNLPCEVEIGVARMDPNRTIAFFRRHLKP